MGVVVLLAVVRAGYLWGPGYFDALVDRRVEASVNAKVTALVDAKVNAAVKAAFAAQPKPAFTPENLDGRLKELERWKQEYDSNVQLVLNSIKDDLAARRAQEKELDEALKKLNDDFAAFAKRVEQGSLAPNPSPLPTMVTGAGSPPTGGGSSTTSPALGGGLLPRPKRLP